MINSFVRYVGVQVVAYAIDIGGFLVFSLFVGPIVANVLSKVSAGIFAFLAHRRVTFEVSGHSDGRVQLVKYALLLSLNVPVSSGLLVLLLKWVSPPVFAKVVSDVFCVWLTFLASRYVVFTRSHPAGTT